MSKVFILGDIHQQFGNLNKFIESIKESYRDQEILLIQTGDFGFWPHFLFDVFPWPLTDSENKYYNGGDKYLEVENIKLLFCEGNHDDIWALNKLVEEYGITPIEIKDDIFYMPRGSTYKLQDGRNILFMGGAESIDKNFRTLGVDWFPEETIKDRDLNNLPDNRVDILISHTNSREYINTLSEGRTLYHDDCSQDAISYIINKYKPSLHFFSHWHMFKQGKLNNTYWTCLNQINDQGWYIELV